MADLHPITGVAVNPVVARQLPSNQPAKAVLPQSTFVQQTMRRAEKADVEMLLARSGAELCIVWGRDKIAPKRSTWWSRHVVADSAGHARRTEELFQRYDFNVATNPGDRLAAVLLYAGAARGAAEIRTREPHRLRKRGSGKREPW